MKSAKLSRRDAARVLGAGAAVSVVMVGSSSKSFAAGFGSGEEVHADVSAESQVEAITPSQQAALAVVAPLVAGSRLSRWTVASVLPVRDGAASVLVQGAEGSFQLDVVARGPAAKSPGVTEYFEVAVANRGNGATATSEAQGLAAMALADVIRSNEQAVDRSMFVSLEQRRLEARSHLHELDLSSVKGPLGSGS